MSMFTLVHVALSLVGIVSGFVVLGGLLADKRLDIWTVLFLITTAATSITGFCFLPFSGFTPGQVFGILSMILLALATYARSVRQLAGVWRKVYTITAIAALYLNVFVLVVQSFQKIPALKALAPTQSEPPFFIAQGLVLLVFLVLGFLATIKFSASTTPLERE